MQRLIKVLVSGDNILIVLYGQGSLAPETFTALIWCVLKHWAEPLGFWCNLAVLAAIPPASR